MEEWKYIENYPNYLVSNLGNIKNTRNKILKPHNNGNGYLQVCLYLNNKPKYIYIHRLVCKHFLENYDNELEIDHIDINPSNNNINNLRQATRSQNCLNKKKKEGTYSKYKNVSFDTSCNKWISRIRINGIRNYVGKFKTEEEAYNAYCKYIKDNNIDCEFRDNSYMI
jgi:hypothetical protein